MNDLERVMKAFANKRRLAIVRYLKVNGEARVGDVAGVLRLSIKSTSKHLAILASQNILEKDQRSVEVFYRLAKNPNFSVRQIIRLV